MRLRRTPVWAAVLLAGSAALVFGAPGLAMLATNAEWALFGLLVVVLSAVFFGLPVYLILRSSVFTGPAWYVCRGCGYDLRGVGGRRCPECGGLHPEHVA